MLAIVLIILTLWYSIRTISYGIYEFKNGNKSGGTFTIIIAIIGFLFPNAMVWINGFY